VKEQQLPACPLSPLPQVSVGVKTAQGLGRASLLNHHQQQLRLRLLHKQQTTRPQLLLLQLQDMQTATVLLWGSMPLLLLLLQVLAAVLA